MNPSVASSSIAVDNTGLKILVERMASTIHNDDEKGVLPTIFSSISNNEGIGTERIPKDSPENQEMKDSADSNKHDMEIDDFVTSENMAKAPQAEAELSDQGIISAIASAGQEIGAHNLAMGSRSLETRYPYIRDEDSRHNEVPPGLKGGQKIAVDRKAPGAPDLDIGNPVQFQQAGIFDNVMEGRNTSLKEGYNSSAPVDSMQAKDSVLDNFKGPLQRLRGDGDESSIARDGKILNENVVESSQENQVVDTNEGADLIPGVDDLPVFANEQSKALNDEIKVKQGLAL